MLSRSAAQQVEHWARIGRQIEALGLTVIDVAELLAGRTNTSEASLWAHKRVRQEADLRKLEGGDATTSEMSWFSGGRARKARIPGTPF